MHGHLGGFGACKLLYLEWMSNGILLYSTGKCVIGSLYWITELNETLQINYKKKERENENETKRKGKGKRKKEMKVKAQSRFSCLVFGSRLLFLCPLGLRLGDGTVSWLGPRRGRRGDRREIAGTWATRPSPRAQPPAGPHTTLSCCIGKVNFYWTSGEKKAFGEENHSCC